MNAATNTSHRRVRLTIAGVGATLAALIAFGLYFQPDDFDSMWEGWPGWLSIQAEHTVGVLLALWAVFGNGRWWLRWPIALAAVFGLLLATTYVNLLPTPGGLFETVFWARLIEDLPRFGAALLVWIVAYSLGRRATIARDDATSWRFTLSEVFGAMLLCSLLLLAVRWTIFNEGAAFEFRWRLWGPRDGSSWSGGFIPMIVVSAVGMAVAAFAALATIATARPHLLLIALVLALGYGVGVLAWLVQPSLFDRPGDCAWEGTVAALQTGLVVASLLAMRLAGLRFERPADKAPAVSDSPPRETPPASVPSSPADV